MRLRGERKVSANVPSAKRDSSFNSALFRGSLACRLFLLWNLSDGRESHLMSELSTQKENFSDFLNYLQSSLDLSRGEPHLAGRTFPL